MANHKPGWAPPHKRHEAYEHNVAPRLEGIVKNRGTRPVRKPKADVSRVRKEAEKYASEQLQAWEQE